MYSTPSKKRGRSRSRNPKTPRKKLRYSDTPITTETQSTAVVPRYNMSSALPKSTTVKLKYFQQLTLNPVGGGVAVNVFSANGAYDPDITGAGGQPRGLDQWFALYTKGLVTSSKITVKGMSPTAIDIGLVGVTLQNKTAVETTPKLYIEDPRCSWFQFANTASVDQEARLTFGAKSFFNVKDPIDDDTLQFSSVTNPPLSAYYHVWYGAPSSTYDSGAIVCQVVIEYNITFFQPVALGSS